MLWCVRGKDPKLLQLAWILTGFHTFSTKQQKSHFPKEKNTKNRGQEHLLLLCSSVANGFSQKNLFATNCIHKLLKFTNDFWEIRNFESRSNALHPAEHPACSVSAGTEAPRQGWGRCCMWQLRCTSALITPGIQTSEKLHPRCCCQPFCAQHLQPIPGAGTCLCLLLNCDLLCPQPTPVH